MHENSVTEIGVEIWMFLKRREIVLTLSLELQV